MIKFPFFNSQELNLDWIMLKLKEILKFMPLNGNVGDVLQRKADGAAWEALSAVSMDIHSLNSTTPDLVDEIPIYDVSVSGNRKTTIADIQSGITAPVTSVNTKTGAVVLDKTDIGLGNVANVAQYSASNPPPYPVTSVNGQTGDVVVSGSGAVDSVNGKTGTVVLTASDVGALPSSYTSPVTSVNTKTGAVVLDKTDIGLGNVANVAQYSASNPPPYPVTSVNGMTGEVNISTSGLAFNASARITITSDNADTSLVSQDLWADVSTDSHAIRVYGHIGSYGPTNTAGWREFTVTGVSTAIPSSTIGIYTNGIMFEEFLGTSNPPSYLCNNYGNVRLRIDPQGNIKIGLYFPTIAPSFFSATLFPIPLFIP